MRTDTRWFRSEDGRIRGVLRGSVFASLMLLVASCGGAEELLEVETSEAVAVIEPAPPPPPPPVVAPPPPAPLIPPPPPDQDADGVIDATDNCPNVVNPDQVNLDALYAAQGLLAPDGEPVAGDGLGDACDPDRDGDRVAATYASAGLGEDANPGTFVAPVRTLARALEIAVPRADEIRLAVGSYVVGELAWPSHLVLRGGYATDFGSRVLKGTTPATASMLLRQGSAVGLDLSGRQDLSFDGVLVRHQAAGSAAVAVLLSGSGATFRDCVVEADPKALWTTGLQVEAQSALTLERSRILVAAESTGIRGVGVMITDSEARLANNIVQGSGARHSDGIELRGAAVQALHNTIRVGAGVPAPTSASALIVEGGTLTIGNNLLLTEVAIDQVPLLCEGTSLAGAVLQANGLVAVGGSGPQPIAVDCAGTYFFPADVGVDALPFAGASLEASVAPIVGALDEIVVDEAAPVHPAVWDVGAVTLNQQYELTDDYYGGTRAETPDLGAVEVDE